MQILNTKCLGFDSSLLPIFHKKNCIKIRRVGKQKCSHISTHRLARHISKESSMTWFSLHKIETSQTKLFSQKFNLPSRQTIYLYAMIYPFSCQFSVTFIPSFKCILKYVKKPLLWGSRSIIGTYLSKYKNFTKTIIYNAKMNITIFLCIMY